MKDVKMRLKENYLSTATWEELFVLTEHWESDLYFYRDEIQFLSDLIGKYFIWMVKEANVSKVQEVANRLSSISKQREDLSSGITKHLNHLELLMENAFSHDETQFREEHVKLEENIAQFTKEFRRLKKEIFSITEHIIESEKLQHLLAS